MLHNSKEEKIRLYGIDTPEIIQWYGQNAKQFTSSQVFDKTVEVESIDTNRYGPTVEVVSVEGLVLNRMLGEYEYAWLYDSTLKSGRSNIIFCLPYFITDDQTYYKDLSPPAIDEE